MNCFPDHFFHFIPIIEVQHYAREDIDQRRIQLLEKRSTLQDKSAKRKVKLQDSFLYQQFDRDISETKGWINEKLKVANDENYLDPTNLSGKLQKHQNFDVELSANKNRLDEVTKAGQELVDASHANSELIQSKMEEVNTMWTDLINGTEKKGVKLQEACQQQQYNR